MEWGLFNYAPVAHYDKRIEELSEDTGFEDEDILPDGGSRTEYFWSGEDGIVYHTEVGEDMVNPFFGSVPEAEQYLERQADKHGKEPYTGLVLRKSGNQKVKESTDVLTEQQGLDEYFADGGQVLPEGYDSSLMELAESADRVEW
jgi:hypothetical protein